MATRRGFLLGLGGAVATAIVAPKLILPAPRVILSPQATVFLPPDGGWLRPGQTIDQLVEEVAKQPARTVTLRALNGAFRPGTTVTLLHDAPDKFYRSAIHVLASEKLTASDVDCIVLRTYSRASSGLIVRVQGEGLVAPMEYRLQSGWAGDYERFIPA